MVSVNRLKAQFSKLIGSVQKEYINELAKQDHSIYMVVNGLKEESFGLTCHNLLSHNYTLLYVSNKSGKTEAEGIGLHVNTPNRNEMTAMFAGYISQKNKTDNTSSIFNTYQVLQQQYFEGLGFFVYGDDFPKRAGKIIIKNCKGAIYVPTIAPKSTNTGRIEAAKKKELGNYVYLMYNRIDNRYKIGRSKDAIYRERTLQSQQPDIILIEAWEAPPKVEKELHRRYKDKRVRGEWFDLSESDLNEIVLYMSKFNVKQ